MRLKPRKLLAYKPFLCHFLALLMVLCNSEVAAQKSDQIDSDLNQIIQFLVEEFIESNETEGELDYNTLTEVFDELKREKKELNELSHGELSQLYFLSEIEIFAILSYRDNFGPFINVYELQAVRELTSLSRSIIKHLLIVGNQRGRLHNVLTIPENKNELFIKLKYQPEISKGFMQSSGNQAVFIGGRESSYLRYRHNSRKVRIGATFEKDSGEAYNGSLSELGFDFASYFIEYRNTDIKLSRLILGDYQVSFGQGLIAFNSFGSFKSGLVTSIQRNAAVLGPYSSIGENVFSRGFASEWELSIKSKLFLGLSIAKKDANISDSTTVSSFQNSGFHKTEAEIEDKDAIKDLSFFLRYENNFGSLGKWGVNYLGHRFNKSLKPREQLYNLFDFKGDRVNNASFDHNVQIANTNIFGEIAVSQNGSIALVQGLVKSIDPKIDVALLFRSYDKAYQTLDGQGFGEYAGTQNERGIYFGSTYRFSQQLTLHAYYDSWSHEWLRFRINAPSTGNEFLLRLEHRRKRQSYYYFQFKIESKFENLTGDLSHILANKKLYKLRLQLNNNITKSLELRTRIEFTRYTKENSKEQGFLFYQDALYKKIGSPYSISARISYFNISDFNARIYAYENDLLHEHYVPFFNGHGLRYYLNLRHRLSHLFSIEFRFGQTSYFNREEISSGNNLITGNKQSLVKAQIQMKF